MAEAGRETNLQDTRVRYPLAVEREADQRLDYEQARSFLGVDAEDFEAEVLGRYLLPRNEDGFAYHDLVALALDVRLPRSVPALGLRMMMRFADQSREALVSPARWEFRMTLSETEVSGDGELVLREPCSAVLELREEYVRASAGDGWIMPRDAGVIIEGTIDTSGHADTLINTDVSALYDEIIRLFQSDVIRFQWVSDVGRDAWERTWDSGRADCVVLARTADRFLQDRGVRTRMQWGRILGMLDARHVWTEVLDDDGEWRRFDPLFQLNCERLWGEDDVRGEFFRGGAANAMPGWPGESSMLVRRDTDGEHGLFPTFTARRVDA